MQRITLDTVCILIHDIKSMEKIRTILGIKIELLCVPAHFMSLSIKIFLDFLLWCFIDMTRKRWPNIYNSKNTHLQSFTECFEWKEKHDRKSLDIIFIHSCVIRTLAWGNVTDWSWNKITSSNFIFKCGQNYISYLCATRCKGLM